MNTVHTWPWLALVLLGAWHGINPAMGWLFAVALGLQERKGSAVWRALFPLALGHALAVAGAIGAAALIGMVVPLEYLKWVVAATLLAFGAYRLIRHRHPRWGGMRVGAWDLTVWSFLMASAHGAGLMVLPFVLGLHFSMHGATGHAGHLSGFADPATGLVATLVHMAGYLLVTALVAWVVYERLGLRLLRQAWFNLDLIWAAALATTGCLTVLV